VPPAIRLTLHLACAVTAVWALPRLSPLSLGPVALTHGWIGLSFAVVLLAWYLNFTNFMDGIDGIAAVQTICVCAGACVLAASVSAPAPLGAAALAAACLGFLLWNWPPAKIFMGDAGSGFVGFLTGVLTLEYGGVTPALGWPMIILSGVFAVDATVTLCIRAARREPVLQAHRSHAYQMLAARWRRHGPVTMLVAAINVFWLTPIACAVAWGWLSPMAGLALGWLPLVVGVVWVNRTAAAGERVG
jgi:Fuc2NAc and GlcNAc transferase